MDNKKYPDLSAKERATLDVIRDQINLCRSEIAEYNSQFLASTVLCAFVASFATIVQVAKVDTLLNVFYILPSIYFLSLYNVIKYTAEQLKLGAYRQILEREARKYIIGEFLYWEELIPKGFNYMFWGGVVQIFFDVPFSLFILLGFWQLPHNTFWCVIAFFIVEQIIVIFFMAISLLYTKDRTIAILNEHIHAIIATPKQRIIRVKKKSFMQNRKS